MRCVNNRLRISQKLRTCLGPWAWKGVCASMFAKQLVPSRVLRTLINILADTIRAMEAKPANLEDFAARYTAAWCSQNPASVAAFFSSQGSLAINGGPPAQGRSGITEVARSFMTAFPDLRVVMDEVLARENGAEYHWTLLGTNTGPGGTGHRVRISGFERWQFGADGLIFRSQGQFDSAEYQRQLEHGVAEQDS